MDANEMLYRIRAARIRWADAHAGSQAETLAGADMSEAFSDLDAHLKAGGALPADWDIVAENAWLTDALTNVIRAHVSGGRRIQAIKEVRTASGMGLRDAKDWLDMHYPSAYMPIA